MNYYERFSKQMAWYGHPVDKEKTSNLVKIKTRIKRRDQANCHVSTHPEMHLKTFQNLHASTSAVISLSKVAD